MVGITRSKVVFLTFLLPVPAVDSATVVVVLDSPAVLSIVFSKSSSQLTHSHPRMSWFNLRQLNAILLELLWLG